MQKKQEKKTGKIKVKRKTESHTEMLGVMFAN
jgi:hypothetical protein